MTLTNEPCPHPLCSPASGAGCAKAMFVKRKKQWPAKAAAAGGRESPVYMQVSIARASRCDHRSAHSAHQVNFAFPAAQLKLRGRHFPVRVSPVCTVSGDHHVQCRSRSDRPLSGLFVWVQTSHERDTHVWVEIHPAQRSRAMERRRLCGSSAPRVASIDSLVCGEGHRPERAHRGKTPTRRGKAGRRCADRLSAVAPSWATAQGGIASQ
jgi:hypothetical protein